MTDEQREALDRLRRDGHAVVIFNPDELRGASAGDVEILLAIHGCDVIDSLATEADPDYCEDETDE